jgi:transposase
VFPIGHAAFLNVLTSIIDNPQYSHRLQDMLIDMVIDMVIDMLSEYKTMVNRLKSIEKQLTEFVEGCESGRILLSIPSIGVINASAFLAAIDKGQAFNNPKELAVWLGLTPKQHASGDVNKMGGIIKRGDRYLRKQLLHGARSVVSRAAKNMDPLSLWAVKLRVTKLFNKMALAMAHRLARLIWVLLTRQEHYHAMPPSLEVNA